MPIQSRDLMMVGLGVHNDLPPNDIQPPLKEGIHLRWAFQRDRGFPWHGYYLFRRNHRSGKFEKLPVSRGKVTDAQGRAYRVYHLESPAYRVRVRINFLEAGQTVVAALMWGTPVDQQAISGDVRDTLDVDFAYDTITSIRIPFEGPAIDFEILGVTVAAEAGIGWEFVPEFLYPMQLPVSEPAYPCTAGIPENLSASRNLAEERIRYGDAGRFTALPASTYTWGKVSVASGSFLVSGYGTRWEDALIGWVLQVGSDPTAYTIVKVVDEENLVLSRPYGGPTLDGVGYVIHQDHFGQLHDQLAQLVSGGPGSGQPMAQRSLPQQIHTTGTVSLVDDSHDVDGAGTAWTDELAGLDLQLVGAEAGTVQVQHGFMRVSVAAGPGWPADLAGMSFQVAGDPSSYIIARVESPRSVILERPYAGATSGAARYKIFERATYPIAGVLSRTRLRLARPYRGPQRSHIGYAIFSGLRSPGRGEQPSMPQQSPLDMVLLGTLHPAVAQMVGLYWVDSWAEQGQVYDYLILADHRGRFEGDPEKAKQLASKVWSFPDVDGYIVFDETLGGSQPLSPPTDLRAYALPATGRMAESPNNAGLTWDYGAIGGVLLPDQAVMAHLWRADLGETEPSGPPADDSYGLITQHASGEQPVLVSAPHPGLSPERPADWPPFPLMAIDHELADGWYSYKVSGIDIFGRHSKQSGPASWYQWDPVPDPKPWYYQDPAGHAAIHSFAVRLLDKMPPPPPAGIEAFALDPADPTVVQDADYLAWRESLSPEDRDTLVGLRVRWLWTLAHMAQSPDTREFRIYYHPGRQNALPGKIDEVSVVSLEQSDVTLTNPGDHPAEAYTGALLQTGPNAYKIEEGSGDAELRLRVRNIGPHYRVGTITAEHDSATVEGVNSSWRTDLTAMVLQIDGETTPYQIIKVLSPTRLMLEAPYAGTTGDEKSYQIFKAPRAGIPCSLVFPSPQTGGRATASHGSRTVTGTKTHWGTQVVGQHLKLAGEHDQYRITAVDPDLQQVTLDRAYEGRATGKRAYAITHPQFVDYRETANWDQRIHVVPFDKEFRQRIPPMRDKNDYPLTGPKAMVTGSTVFLLGRADNERVGTIAAEHGSAMVEGMDTAWGTDLTGMVLQIDGETILYRITQVLSPTRLMLEAPYAGTTGGEKNYEIFKGSEADLSTVDSNMVLYLENDRAPGDKRYNILLVDNDDDKKTVTVSGTPDLGGGSSLWIIGPPIPLRFYEVFLPAPDTAQHGSFAPSTADPIVYAHIGVSATDGREHTADHPRWAEEEHGGWTPEERYGNEGSAGPAAGVYRVLRDRPDAPKLPPTDSDRVYATAADYHGKSFYTYRWFRGANLKTHIFRALDDSLFKVDWARRERNPYTLSASDESLFPEELSSDDRREAVISELNELTTFDHDSEGKPRALAYYRGLTNDALRVLAGLPGNERAFTQITIQPLDPEDEATYDERGPDDPEGYVATNPDLRIYLDTLPGRSSNRYFYRAAYVDGAQNRSHLSLASPPVYLPKVTPPRTPVITKVLGGDRQITLRWTCSREPELVEYRIYRTDKKEIARDVRLMTLIDTQALSPDGQPSFLEYTDLDVVAGCPYFYRIVSVDQRFLISAPSKPVHAQAYEDTSPAGAFWEESVRTAGGQKARLAWWCDYPQRCLIKGRRTDVSFSDVLQSWTDGVFNQHTGYWHFQTMLTNLNPDLLYEIFIIGKTKAGNRTSSEKLIL